MTGDEKDVVAAVQRFYDAIEQLVSGKGVSAMHEAWHRDLPTISSAHPVGEWARGWEEIAATWDVFASFGAPGRGGSRVRDIEVHVVGDLAWATSVFEVSPAFGGTKLNCTNVLQRVGGVWKVVHHHADKDANVEKALAKLLE